MPHLLLGLWLDKTFCSVDGLWKNRTHSHCALLRYSTHFSLWKYGKKIRWGANSQENVLFFFRTFSTRCACATKSVSFAISCLISLLIKKFEKSNLICSCIFRKNQNSNRFLPNLWGDVIKNTFFIFFMSVIPQECAGETQYKKYWHQGNLFYHSNGSIKSQHPVFLYILC